VSKLLSDKFSVWQAECETRFQQLKANEEELNRIFIGIYGLQDELTPEVADKDVTVHRIFRTKDDVPESMKGSAYVRTLRDEIVSLLSYAVGCMFGRYSLDVEGLAYAGGDFSEQWAVVSIISGRPWSIMSVKSYKELLVWQKAMLLTEETYRLAKLLPREELYALSGQMRRAAVSIPSNIAEGQARSSTKEFVNFLSIARGSTAELETQLTICVRLKYLQQSQTGPALSLCSEVGKMLNALIGKLSAAH
jgi:four helix bundle protein